MAGKGDTRRPRSVPMDVWGDNYDAIFKKKPVLVKKKKPLYPYPTGSWSLTGYND